MFRIKGCFNGNLQAVLPNDSTVTGMISSSDIGKLIIESSNLGGLALGSTADLTAHSITGIVASVPEDSTASSTTPFYIAPIEQGKVYEADFSTTYSTSLPATTDIGKFIGVSNTTTVAGGSYLDMASIGNTAGSTSGRFFKITSVSTSMTDRRVIEGVFNSSHVR